MSEPLAVAQAFLRAEHARLVEALDAAYAEVDAPNADLNRVLAEHGAAHPLIQAYDRAAYLSSRVGSVQKALQALCEHPRAEPWTDHGIEDREHAERCPDCREVSWFGHLRYEPASTGWARIIPRV